VFAFFAPPPAQKPLRRKINFLSQINLICPVQSPMKKYFCFSENQITPIFSAIPSHSKGRIMIVAKRGAGCGGREWRF
jgi:hypothetical protein